MELLLTREYKAPVSNHLELKDRGNSYVHFLHTWLETIVSYFEISDWTVGNRPIKWRLYIHSVTEFVYFLQYTIGHCEEFKRIKKENYKKKHSTPKITYAMQILNNRWSVSHNINSLCNALLRTSPQGSWVLCCCL